MLLTADPEVPLRIGDRRVFNGVFVDELQLVGSHNLQRLAQHVRAHFPELPAGEVATAGSLAARDFNELLQKLLINLEQDLESYGFLNKDNRGELHNEAQFMATRGAEPHVDTGNSDWEQSLFWVYVLESQNADLVFANLALRVPLSAGQLILFDPAQPHGVYGAESEVFKRSDFPTAKRQAYIAGHLTYDDKFWKRLGLNLDARALRQADFVESDYWRVCKRTGRIKMSS